MALNPKMVLASDLQSLFRDKITGLPLSGGQVFFYSDSARGTEKHVYQLTGSAMTGYTYAELKDPIVLSSIGTMQDELGNDIVVYWYPYVGDPADDSDTVELYFVRVVASDGSTVQFDRQAWPYPNVGGSGGNVGENDQVNFIPNGQFLAHSNGDAQFAESINLGTVTLDVKNIAYGGWTQEDQNGIGGTYTTAFTATQSGAAYLNDFPPFSLDYASTSASIGIHQVGIKWRNVSEFEANDTHANLGDTTYSFAFNAVSQDGGTYDFDVYVIKYYGSGGSTTSTVSAGSVSISPSGAYKQVSVTFGSNLGTTIGAGNYVQLVLRPRLASTFQVRLTDFILALGNITFSSFPPMPPAQMLTDSIAGWMPLPATDGSDLYLPLVLTPQGMTFDHSIVGQIVGKTQTLANVVNNELLMDGTTYVYSDYNATTGIPYSRLADYLIANSPAITIGTSIIPVATIPLYGTGANFVTIYGITGSPTLFIVQINTTASGGSATQVSASITIAATSANNYYTATVGSVPSAGDYWTFTDGTVNKVYNVWYSVNGAGTAPATPTGANIEVPLVTGDTTATTVTKTQQYVNQYQFAIVDARGYFWRGVDATAVIDLGAATRTIANIAFNGTAMTGANLGSVEVASYLNHSHTATSTTSIGASTNVAVGAFAARSDTNNATLSPTTTTTVNTSTTGGNETRPINLALNWFIKY